jgi:tetratricopeptide (TPR) repeat protein
VILLSFLDKLFKKKIEGKTAEEWYGLGVSETDPEKKIEYFDKVLALKPDFSGVWNLRGLELVILKRYEDAIASFDKALEIRPSYLEAKYNKEDADTELRKMRLAEGKDEGEKEKSDVEKDLEKTTT